jgi:hypothetical protein
MCIIRQNGWHITRGTQSERRVLHLESRCYNKSHPGPKLMTSLRLMIESLSLLVSNPCLTFLSSACISLNSQPSVLLGSHLLSSHIIMVSQVTHVTISPYECSGVVDSTKYPTGCRFTSSHVVLFSHVTSRTMLFYLSKWMSFLIALENHFCWRPL